MGDYEGEMDFDKLLNIFQDLNPEIEDISKNFQTLKEDIETIYGKYEKMQNSFLFFDDDIMEFKNTSELSINQIDHSLIAKMIYENEKYFGFVPRKVQILSLIYFLKKEKNKGLVQQINTGEGKSCIISFLAVYIALKQNKKIDILTSSSVLAKRDSELFVKFYNSFNLKVDFTCDHNENVKNNNKKFTQEPYDCYKADIVYGDALSFEGDFLRTYFMGIRGRGLERKFDCIIIDEIDNIAIDNLKNTTELLDSFHGYKFLEYVYLFIYKTLKEITDNDKESKNKKDEIIEKLKNEFIEEFSDLDKLREEKFVFIPKHLEGYIHDRLDDWCESAYLAKFIYKINENYVISFDEEYKINIINPVDFYNTGVIQANTVWSGLHQFLQISEKLMITEENLSSCYISNLSFFNKYIKKSDKREIIENNIYGLTGTIGSKYNKKTLKELYKLDSLIIPSYKESLLIIDKPNILIIKNDEEEKKDEGSKNKKKGQNQKIIGFEDQWFNNIIKKIDEIIKEGRSVLVIFQYISQAIRMEQKLKQIGKKLFNKIILYLRSDNEDESQFLKKNIETRTVILSTNLAGRGTDIKISRELNRRNGLHVILTYEPFNQRIERQAFGRAGRKGENGSAEKIIYSCMTQEEAINEMNKREQEESDFLINVYSKKIQVFERIFNKFSAFISEIERRTHDVSLVLDLKERWGLFLIKNSDNNIEKKYKKNHESVDINKFFELEKEYDKFEEKLSKYYYGFDLYFDKLSKIVEKTSNITKSMNYENYVFLNGINLNLHSTNNIEKANEGVELCPDLCVGGYMLQIIEYINQINSIPILNISNNTHEEMINEIKKTFNKLIKCLEALIEQFKTYRKILGFLGYNKDGLEISQQNNQKISLMENILDLMKENSEVIKNYNKKKEQIFLKVIRFSLSKFIEVKKLEINKLVIEYFKEYGLRLFILREKKRDDGNNCFIY